SLALSTIFLLLFALTSSIFFTIIFAEHGPTLSIVSRAAANKAVSTLCKLDGIRSKTSLLPVPTYNKFQHGFAHQIALIVEQVVVGGNSEQELTHIADQIANRIDLAKHARQALENIDSRELEAMFREIAGKELRFVEISGALLGSLIGVINGILTLLLTA
ncbi:MAG TPA: DUF445 family protein, partial [Pyrodictiaceae archaeon]|nr:DUF445 family protein [Pyrodictiaceae archaeon]